LAQIALKILVASLPSESSCECDSALKNAIITRPECIPPETISKLSLLVKKYL
jgi:hypothetical protein